MARTQLFEFNDLASVPEFIRDSVVEVLGEGLRAMDFGAVIGPKFRDFVERAKVSHVLDLASGSGIPATLIVDWLGDDAPHFVLSDLFPHEVALREQVALHPERLEARLDPVDASAVPEGIPHDSRTIINAFHHFGPALARAILTDAVKQRKAVFVYEGFPRNLARILPAMPHMGSAMWLNPLRTRRNALLKALFTYGLPLIPLIGIWDAMVSVLRVYTQEELLALTDSLGDDFEWTYTEFPFGWGGIGVVFTGIPRERL